MFAIVTETGAILSTSLKHPSTIPYGCVVKKYVQPDLDPKLYHIQPVQPVTTPEVEFLVVPNHEALKAFYLDKVDKDVDLIYGRAIGNRGPEYTQAEKEALEYKASGFTDPTPPYVSSWASATGITNVEAAEGIIAQAAAWRTASLLIRTNRLLTKESIRLGNYESMVAWESFTTNIRRQLNI